MQILSIVIPVLITMTGSAGERPAGKNHDDAGPFASTTKQPASLHSLQRRQQLMGTWLDITTWANDRSLALEASDAAFVAVREAEIRLSTWREETELAVVNDGGPVAPVEISPLLERDLAEALTWYQATGGAFSPGVGSLVTLWDLRGHGRVPSRVELDGALADASLDGTEIEGGRIRFGQPGLQIEEGGFGKGAALSDAIDAALGLGARCVILDFGGQVAIGGSCEALTIGISDPGDRERVVGLLSVTEGSIATSGLSERYFVADNVRYGHIIDPRTGSPTPDWGSVTVLAPDPIAADCISTALFVMGPESGMIWVNRHPGVEAVFSLRSDAGSQVVATPGLKGHLTPSEGVMVEWIPTVDARQHDPPHFTSIWHSSIAKSSK